MQDGCKSLHGIKWIMLMVTWTIFENCLLEVGLTQTWETMVLRMLTTIDLLYFIMCEDPREQAFIELTFGGGPGHIRLHTTLEDL